MCFGSRMISIDDKEIDFCFLLTKGKICPGSDPITNLNIHYRLKYRTSLNKDKSDFTPSCLVLSSIVFLK